MSPGVIDNLICRIMWSKKWKLKNDHEEKKRISKLTILQTVLIKKHALGC